MTDKEELINAAKILKEYCLSQECDGCEFHYACKHCLADGIYMGKTYLSGYMDSCIDNMTIRHTAQNVTAYIGEGVVLNLENAEITSFKEIKRR